MKAAIEGVWTEDSTSKYADQLKIDGDTVIWRLDKTDPSYDLEMDIRSYDPAGGTFKAGAQEIIVKSNGDLEFMGDTFKKGGTWTKLSTSSLGSSSSSSSSSSFESAYSVLKMSGTISSNTSYTILEGTIKNNGSKTYRYVQVKGSFKDANGNVVDTDWTYAVGSEGLAPGESKTFRLSVPKNSGIKSCSLSIIDYD